MMNAKINEFIYDLSLSRTDSHVNNAWNKFNKEFSDPHVIVSLENYNKNVYPKNLQKLLNENDDFVDYFTTGNLYFLNRSLYKKMKRRWFWKVKFTIDYSVTLDTNYASYVRDFVKGNREALIPQVRKNLEQLLLLDFKFDYNFYNVENYFNIILNRYKDSNSNSLNNQTDMYQNLVCFELFKNINLKKYFELDEVEFLISESEANEYAMKMFNKYFLRETPPKYLSDLLDLHSDFVLLLIGIYQIKFDNKTTYKSRMKKVINFMFEKIGIYMERELIVFATYFQNQNSINMMSKVNKNLPRKRVLEEIQNIAWDFLVPRVIGSYITSMSNEAFYIPLFLSHDKGLKQLLSLLKIKGIVYDKFDNCIVPISDLSLEEALADDELLQLVEMRMTNESKALREAIAWDNRKNNHMIINDELDVLYEKMCI